MNIFKTPKLDPETSQKLGDRILTVFVIALVCFIASLVVRLFVLERIKDSRVAFQGIDTELPTLFVQPSRIETEITTVDLQNRNSTTSSMQVEKNVVNNPEIKIEANPETKILGKQKFIAFDADVNIKESFVLPANVTNTFITVPIFIQKDVKDFKIKAFVDDKQINLDSNINKDNVLNGEYKIMVPGYLGGKTIDLEYSWNILGSRTINFKKGVYSAEIYTNSKNVRINRSEYGHLNKSGETSVVFNFDKSYQPEQNKGFRDVEFDYAQLEFLAGADDITMIDRITKYASIVIVLTFFIIFLLDLRRKFIVNKIQYVLVGASLCLFYLLNLSLGESIGFTLAYFVATAVTMLINGIYVGTFMDSKKYGVATATGLLIIYGLIYWLIKIQSVNLLVGTIILYVVLMIMMFYTARINKNNN